MKLKHSLVITILAILISVFTAASVMAEPISGNCGESTVTYEIGDNQTLTIAGSGAMPGYKDAEAPWSAHASSILNLVIKSGVTELGEYAFVNVTANADIPDSVTKIGEYALGYVLEGTAYKKIPGYTITGSSGSAAEKYATNNGFKFNSTTPKNVEGACGNGLTFSLTPGGVLTITGNGSMYSFSSSSPAWSSYVSGNGDYVIKEVIIEKGVTSIGDRAFKGCSSLSKLTIGSSVNSIGNEAFANCTALTALYLPSSVTEIGSKAFSYCTSLTSATLNDDIESIGSNAFELSGLTDVSLPRSLTDAGENIFYGCTSLTSAVVKTSFVPIGAFAECTSLKSVTLTIGVSEIGESAFEGCTALTTISSPYSLNKIGAYAFAGCTSLSNVNFESNVTEYGPYCFKDCTSIKSFIFSDSVKTIPEGMFFCCYSLSQVTVGDNVTSIGEYAFAGCSALNKIFLSYKVRQIGQYAIGYIYKDGKYFKFNNIEIEGFTPSVAKTYAEENSITFTHYKTVDTDSGEVCDGITWKFRPSTGVLNIIGSGTMPDYLTFEETPWYVYSTYIKHVTFSNGILNIGSSSFEGCSTIEQIDIPASVQIIGTSAFAGTSIITATIPTGVREIANSAFEGCNMLYTISLPDTLTKIGEAAFRGPNSVNTVFIPTSVAEIGAYAIGYNAHNTVVADFLIKGMEGSIANTYADQNDISFIVNGYVEISDKSSGCIVSIPDDSTFGYKLEFTKLQSTFTPALIIPSDQTILQYEIRLTLNDLSAYIDGSAEVSFPIPEGMTNRIIYLYSVTQDGEFVGVNFTNNDGRIVFSYTSLGKFVLSTVDLSTLYEITINYKYENGSPAKDPVTVRATNGAQYRFTADSIKGYSLNEYAFAGTVNGENITIEFIYTKSSVGNGSNGSDPKGGEGAGTRVILTVLLIILVIALISAVILFIYLNGKKKKQQNETGKTMRDAEKKPDKPDVLAATIVVPDFATREIDIESLFADEPEEDIEAVEENRKKQLSGEDNKN